MKITVVTPTIRSNGLEITHKCLLRQTFRDFEWLTEYNTSGMIDVNYAYNAMLKRARGELIVSLQDYTFVQPDFLQKWWAAYQQHPRAFMTAPVGKVDDLTKMENIRWDWRSYRNDETTNVRPCTYDCWEIDNGAAPLAALKEIGGFDEALDNCGNFAGDNVNVACRAELAGYEFLCLFDNPGVAWDHNKFTNHPFLKDTDSTNSKRMVMFRGGMVLPPLH